MVQPRQRRGKNPALARGFEEDDRLSAAANRGDSAAAAVFLQRNQRLLMTTARRLSQSMIDPDDLLSDALVNLLALWKSGSGPKEKAGAYVIRSMRNRMIDEFRSPRSRVLPLIDAEEQMPPVVQDTRRIDLDAEFRRVRRALTLLPADQQHVLRATIIDGRKPADLEHELDRAATSIYALSLRARRSLRRALLRVMLEEDSPPDACRHAASRLPPLVTEDIDQAADSPGMEHIRDCPRCRRAWGRFAATASVLGIATCLLVGEAVFAPKGAQAAESSRSVRARARSLAGRATRPRGFAATLLQTGLPLLAITSGLVLLGTVIVPPIVESMRQPERTVSDSQLVVTAEVVEPRRATLTVRLTGGGAASSLSLTLPDGVTIVSTPEGWACAAADAVLHCEVVGSPDGTVELLDARAEQVGDYRLELSAVIDERSLTGTAWGQITDEPQTVRASID